MTSLQLMIVAGPNGSGKSTLTDQGELVAQGLILPANYINPDQIAKDFEASNPQEAQADREWRAQRQGRALRRQYREQGVSFGFETIFSHPSTLLDMQECKKAGYEVVLIYVTTGAVEINIERVAGRVLQGKHNVAVEKIRLRYERTMRLLPRAVEEADVALVFHSGNEEPMRLCFLKRNFDVPLSPPPYLQTQLVDVLRQRRIERDAIAERFRDISLPEENAGEYTGALLVVLPHYVVQDTRADGAIRHDRLLFPPDASWSEASRNEARSIRYKEAGGEIRDAL